MNSFLNPQWLKDRYKNYSDDDLHDRYREIATFGGADSEKHMIEMESKRREEAHATNTRG